MSRVSALACTKEKFVGTKTERYGVLHSSFLAYEEDGGLKTFGYHRSKEGREFLRILYRLYLEDNEFSDGKVATIIADTPKNPSEEKKEVSRTKQALRRWREDGQAELWPRDNKRNERHLKKLENEFIAVKEFQEVMEDRAETIQKVQSGHALASFFYGVLPFGRTHPDVGYLHARFQGIYEVEHLKTHSPTDRLSGIRDRIIYELATAYSESGSVPKSLDLSPYGLDRSMFEDMDHDILVSKNGPGWTHLRLSTEPGMNFMIAQEFDLKNEDGEPRARNISTGYAFPMLDGTLHILLTKHGPKHKREYLALTPDVTAYREGKYPRKGEDFGWSVSRRPFSEYWELTSNFDNRDSWFKLKADESILGKAVVENCEKYLESIKWNLVP